MRQARRAYIDTSVPGGTQDEEFRDASVRFFDLVRQGKYLVLLSSVTLDELADAPPRVREVLQSLPPACVERLTPEDEDEATELAQAYVEAKVLGPARRADATHVANGTVARADLIVSWNFRHIVNYDRIRQFNGVNALKGYPPIEIRSPSEVVYESDDEEDV